MSNASRTLYSREKTVDSPEESSWTYYFENFICDNDEDSSISSDFESPSLVSDAGSSAAKKFTDSDQPALGFPSDKNRKRLCFKKSRTEGAAVDDDLEDTASSPVNSSPKVSYFHQQMNQEIRNSGGISEKEGVLGQREVSESVNIRGDADYTGLKKRGLCLVPVSMVSNYLS